MRITKQHILKNPIVLTSVIMAMIGWLLMFIGGCIIGRAGLLWWIIIYTLLLLGSIFFSIFRNVFHQYQIMFLVFLGIDISQLTLVINDFINFAYASGLQVTSAGAIILIIMQFFWVILFGSSEDSAVYQLIYSTRISHVSPSTNIALTPKESKVALSSPDSHYQHPSVSSVHQNHVTSPTAPPMVVSQQQESQKTTAVALHPYTANPEDPNELSFAKDEVLEILNTSGNWWQAKKQDGTIGIVPSNYFAQP